MPAEHALTLQEQITQAVATRPQAKALASFMLPNGDKFSLFDLDPLVGYTETGTPPAIPQARLHDDLWKHNQYSALIHALAPDAPIPEAVTELEARHAARRAADPTGYSNAARLAAAYGPSIHQGYGVALNHPDDQETATINPQPIPSTWCGNGCCDSNWVNDVCWQNEAWGNRAIWYPWFDFEYGWASVQTTMDVQVTQLLCPIADGYSNWSIVPTEPLPDYMPALSTQVQVGTFAQWDLFTADNPDCCSTGCGNGEFCYAFSTLNQVNSGGDLRNMTYCGAVLPPLN